MFDVSELIDEESQSNRLGTKCATCAWLRTRPDDEREKWEAEMARSTEERQHASIHRAMTRAVEIGGGVAPPGVNSVLKHRKGNHAR